MHRRSARGLATCIVSDLKGHGRDVTVIGSLATGRFRLHSDIDVLMRSPVDPIGRAAVERAVAAVMRGNGIPYDLIFFCDLTGPQRAAFEQAAES